MFINLTLGERPQILGGRQGLRTTVAFAIQNQRYLWNEAV